MSATKIGENSQHFKLLFFTINLHFVTSNRIPKYRKPNLHLTSSIYLVFLPLEMQGRLKETEVCYTFFYFVWKEATYKPLKSGSSKNPFLQCICYWYNFLRWMFLILCDDWTTLLFIIVYRCSPPCCCFLWNQCFEGSLYFMLSPQ